MLASDVKSKQLFSATPTARSKCFASPMLWGQTSFDAAFLLESTNIFRRIVHRLAEEKVRFWGRLPKDHGAVFRQRAAKSLLPVSGKQGRNCAAFTISAAAAAASFASFSYTSEAQRQRVRRWEEETRSTVEETARAKSD